MIYNLDHNRTSKDKMFDYALEYVIMAACVSPFALFFGYCIANSF